MSASRFSALGGSRPSRGMALAVAAGLGLLLTALALVPSLIGARDASVQVHHLQHAVLIGLGGLYSLVLAWALVIPSQTRGRPAPYVYPVALGVLVVGPVLVMAAMLPATANWTDSYPLLHGIEHLGFVATGCLIGLAGRVFSFSLSVFGIALIAVMAAGMAALAQPAAPTVPASMIRAIAQGSGASGPAAGPGDVAAGRTDFKSLGCVGCHTLTSVGAAGTAGPALNHEGKTQTLDWLMVQLSKPCAPGHQRPGYSCQVMVGVVSSLSERQRKDMAAFLFAEK